MLNKLKRANRGIILAIIAAIALTGFIAVDEITFRVKEVPITQEYVQEYFAALEKAAVSPVSERNSKGSDLTEEGREAFKQRYIGLINEFMFRPGKELTGTRGVGGMWWRWTYEKDDILSWRTDRFDENVGFITKYDLTMMDIPVQKQGPNLASIDAVYNLEMEITLPLEHIAQLFNEVDEKFQENLYKPLVAGLPESDPDPTQDSSLAEEGGIKPPDITVSPFWTGLDVVVVVPLPEGPSLEAIHVTRADFEAAQGDYMRYRLSYRGYSAAFDAQKRSGQWQFYGLGEGGGWGSQLSVTLIRSEGGAL